MWIRTCACGFDLGERVWIRSTFRVWIRTTARISATAISSRFDATCNLSLCTHKRLRLGRFYSNLTLHFMSSRIVRTHLLSKMKSSRRHSRQSRHSWHGFPKRFCPLTLSQLKRLPRRVRPAQVTGRGPSAAFRIVAKRVLKHRTAATAATSTWSWQHFQKRNFLISNQRSNSLTCMRT